VYHFPPSLTKPTSLLSVFGSHTLSFPNHCISCQAQVFELVNTCVLMCVICTHSLEQTSSQVLRQTQAHGDNPFDEKQWFQEGMLWLDIVLHDSLSKSLTQVRKWNEMKVWSAIRHTPFSVMSIHLECWVHRERVHWCQLTKHGKVDVFNLLTYF
jgi:hypothetical protein